MEFLGLRVTASGVAPLPDQVSAAADLPQPTTIKELQAFLGAVNFYRRFIPAAAKILLPLIAVLKGGRKGGELLLWSTPMLEAFKAIKTALLQSVCLAFPRDNAELSLATDASATHIGAVLQQLEPLSGSGSRWVFSQPNWRKLNSLTVPSTGSCLASTQPSGTSATTWRAASSPSGLTTNR